MCKRRQRGWIKTKMERDVTLTQTNGKKTLKIVLLLQADVYVVHVGLTIYKIQKNIFEDVMDQNKPSCSDSLF